MTLNQVAQGPTLGRLYPELDESGRIRRGVRDCLQSLNREWEKEDGNKITPDRLLVDGQYFLDDVEIGVRDSGVAVARVARGVGITASKLPLSEWTLKPGDRAGDHWIERPMRSGRPLVHVDVNYWKSKTQDGLTLPLGHDQAITLHAGPESYHQMFAQHCAAERGVEVHAEAYNRTVREFALKSVGLDNHWWDNVVGSLAGASMAGICYPGVAPAPAKKRQHPVRSTRVEQRLHGRR